MRFLLPILLVLAACAGADETLQRVQKELRARKYFFGPVDGRASPESRAAVAEFQRARGIDATGRADEETLRALGLVPSPAVVSPEARAQQIGSAWVAGYCAACGPGEWKREERFYADVVRYYSEGDLARDDLRLHREKFHALWPMHRMTPIVCFSSWNARRAGELWVSARVRHEATDRAGTRKVFTEDLLFILHESGDGWRLIEAREWPLAEPKDLP